MASNVPDDDICHALLGFVKEGSFPETENVVAAEFPTSAILLQLREISKAKQEVEVWA